MLVEKFKVISDWDHPHRPLLSISGYHSVTTKDKMYTVTRTTYGNEQSISIFVGDDGKEYSYLEDNFSFVASLRDYVDIQLNKILYDNKSTN